MVMQVCYVKMKLICLLCKKVKLLINCANILRQLQQFKIYLIFCYINCANYNISNNIKHVCYRANIIDAIIINHVNEQKLNMFIL